MELLAGLHPFFVHFPIAFFVLHFVFELINYFLEKYETVSLIILLFGVISGLLSVLSGNQAFQNLGEIFRSDMVIIEVINTHELYATLLLWYYFVILVFRYFLQIKKRLNKKLKLMIILFSLLGIFFLYQTGKYGNELVYKYGVGTKPASEIIK